MHDDALLDAVQVAAILGVTKSWVYEATRQGELPAVRIGRYYRYRRESLDRWIAEQER